LEPETQKKILDAGNRFLAEVCEASDSKVKNYEEMNEFVRLKIHEYGNKTLSALLLDWVRKQLPSDNNDQLLKPENLELYLTAMDTREKAEALLLDAPEPDPDSLNKTLKALRFLLPSIRQVLLPVAKRLPHYPGGRPRVLVGASKRQAIRDEIASLNAYGFPLKNAQQRVANEEGVGLRTIQNIWRENRPRRKRSNKLNSKNDKI